MPKDGYTAMFRRMLDHPNIEVWLDIDYREVLRIARARRTIYTGSIDAYFDYRFGKLPYRCLEFRHETVDKEFEQPVAVVDSPNEHEYTRITEFKHLTGQTHPRTSIVYEYPRADGDEYYPIPRPENARLYKKYQELATSTRNVYFVGRLATYRYYNMDQVVAQALTLYGKLTGLVGLAAAARHRWPQCQSLGAPAITGGIATLESA